MALNSRFIIGGALFAAAAHAWWTQPCEKPRKPARKPAQETSSLWETDVTIRCSSCQDRLYDIYRYDDASHCRQCHEKLEQEQETSDEEEEDVYIL